MQERNRYIAALAVSVAVCIVWLLWLKGISNYAIAHPGITIFAGLFVVAVGGGVIVSWVPGVVWDIFSEEDEITGEEE